MGRYSFDAEQHLHMLDGRPLTGTSSVGAVLSKPLTWWASGCAVSLLGWQNSKLVPQVEREKSVETMLEKIKKLTPGEYLTLLDSAYSAHSKTLKSKAASGTDLHAVLEQWVKAQMGKTGWLAGAYPQIEPYIEWSRTHVRKYIASEAHVFSNRLWVGGILDACAELLDGRLAVIDFKSSKAAYESHFLQAAGYAIQIDENGLFDITGKHNKKLSRKIDAVIIVPFGGNPITPEIRENIHDWKSGFEHAVALYRLLGLEKRG